MLQADSEKLRQAWVQAVQASIASAYRESPDSCYREVGPPAPCTRAHSSRRPHASTRVHRVYAHVSVCAHTRARARASGLGLCQHLRLGRRRGPAGETGAERPLTLSPEAGPHGVPVRKQHRLCHGLSGTQRQGRARATASAARGWEQPVWRLRAAGPALGQHQPGRAALHRVLGHPQVGPPGGRVGRGDQGVP